MQRIKPAGPLKGVIRVPGDKSISHRAAILSSLARGTTVIDNFLTAADCISTVKCLRELGVEIEGPVDKRVTVHGMGLENLTEPGNVLDTGNSGTTMRLFAGLLSSLPFFSVLTGDDSLRARPMDRIIIPLSRMGAVITGRRENTRAPIAIRGGNLSAIDYETPVASAQIKSALMLAALNTVGRTRVTEPTLSRDHTERMLTHFGVSIERNERSVTVNGPAVLRGGKQFTVPGDISSAAFFITAASIIPGSDITIEKVGLNPTRTGVLDVLKEMGARVQIENVHEECGEPAADIRVKHSQLKGISLGEDIIPRLIDEVPVIAVAGAAAEGKTVISGAEELKYKETDRIKAVVTELHKMGVDIEETGDGMIIHGGNVFNGAHCHSWGDHRIAMALSVAGLACCGETTVEEPECIEISFPDFYEVLNSLTEE